MLMNSSYCPKLNTIPSVFSGPVIPTGALNIVSAVILIIWFVYRSTHNGIKRLFRQKCCTQFISILLSIFVLGFSIPSIVVITSDFASAAYLDFGSTFWNNWGCSSQNSDNIYCYTSYYSCGDNPTMACTSTSYPDTGFIIAAANLGFYLLVCFYSWIGSWCCSCCCPGVEDEVFPTTVNIQSTPYMETGSSNPLLSTLPITYTLYVHHGGEYPSKLIVSASSLEELKSIIITSLGITIPFKIAIFDEICQQYVMVTSLQLIPNQATLQLIF